MKANPLQPMIGDKGAEAVCDTIWGKEATVCKDEYVGVVLVVVAVAPQSLVFVQMLPSSQQHFFDFGRQLERAAVGFSFQRIGFHQLVLAL